MDRRIPVFNRVIASKTLKQNQLSHLKRLDAIKFGHRKVYSTIKSQYNPKKELMDEEKRTEIEKQNLLLYNKMNRILNRSKNKSHSINLSLKESRQRFNTKIIQENKQLTKRLQNQKPTICNKKLWQDRNKNEKILRYLGEYPYRQRFRSVNTSIQYENKNTHQSITRQTSVLSKLKRKIVKKQNSIQQQLDIPHVKSLNLKNRKPFEQFKDLSKSKDQGQQRNQKISLYKKCLQINHQIFNVEINRLNTEYQFKLTDNQERMYTMFLSQEQGNKIFTDCDYDFELISSLLSLSGDKLHLDLNNMKYKKYINSYIRNPCSNTKQQNNVNKLKSFQLSGQTTEQVPIQRIFDDSIMMQEQIKKTQQLF